MKNIIGMKIKLRNNQFFYYNFMDAVSQAADDVVVEWSGRNGEVISIEKGIVTVVLFEEYVRNAQCVEPRKKIYFRWEDFKTYFIKEEENEMENIIGMTVTLKAGQKFGPDWDDAESNTVIGLAGEKYTVAQVKDGVVNFDSFLYMTLENFKEYFMKNKSGGIFIKTKKEVNSYGQEGRTIVKLRGLPSKKLPDMYKNATGSIKYVKEPNGDSAFYRCTPFRLVLKEGEFYVEEDFQVSLEIIKNAGNLLADINKELKKKREQWQGEEEFVI